LSTEARVIYRKIWVQKTSTTEFSEPITI